MNKDSDFIRGFFKTHNPKTFSEYMSASKTLEKWAAENKDGLPQKLKIALLTSFTTKGLKEILYAKCAQQFIGADIYAAEYNQFNQEILNPASGLHAFIPDVIFLFVDAQSVLGKLYFHPYELNQEGRRAWVDAQVEQLLTLIEKLKEFPRAQIVVHNFQVPTHSPLGILENKQDFGFHEMVKTLNQQLAEKLRPESRVFLFDYDAFASQLGKTKLMDPKMYYLGDMKLELNYLPELCDQFLSYIKPIAGLSKKCIVLDLDNTLWGGILGEDGIEGIKLGPTSDGKPFWELQQHLLSLFDRGMILAVNSRNNLEDVTRVFNEHPYMILKEKHFAAMRVNWEDKASNLKSIAEEINIGIDSLIFMDDDKVNCDLVRTVLPEVQVVEMPEDPALYCNALLKLNDFNLLQLTEEDKNRGAAYASERQREGFKKTVDINDYLKSLNTVLTVQSASPFTIPRIAQLTQKTNQFNMTTRRYLEADIQRFAANPNWGIFSFKLEDKFGDLGSIGVVMIEKKAADWRIDTFLMSCRVLARKIEETILAFILQKALAAGAKNLIGEFSPTDKNAPAKGYYEKQGFELVKEENQLQSWKLPVKAMTIPESVNLKVEEK